jgi:hypothetical protein
MELTGEVAVVTGAAGGLGLVPAIAASSRFYGLGSDGPAKAGKRVLLKCHSSSISTRPTAIICRGGVHTDIGKG